MPGGGIAGAPGAGPWHTRVVGMLAVQPRAVLVAMGAWELFFNSRSLATQCHHESAAALHCRAPLGFRICESTQSRMFSGGGCRVHTLGGTTGGSLLAGCAGTASAAPRGCGGWPHGCVGFVKKKNRATRPHSRKRKKPAVASMAFNVFRN